MRRTRLLLPLLILPALLAMGSPPAPGDWITLRRGPCFGNCPVYEVTLGTDGSARYLGGDYAPRSGEFVGRVDAARVAALIVMLDAVGYWRMPTDRQLRITDMPESVLEAKAAGRRHRVHTNLVPEELASIHAAVDSLAAGVDWRPARSAPEPAATR